MGEEEGGCPLYPQVPDRWPGLILSASRKGGEVPREMLTCLSSELFDP